MCALHSQQKNPQNCLHVWLLSSVTVVPIHFSMENNERTRARTYNGISRLADEIRSYILLIGRIENESRVSRATAFAEQTNRNALGRRKKNIDGISNFSVRILFVAEMLRCFFMRQQKQKKMSKIHQIHSINKLSG